MVVGELSQKTDVLVVGAGPGGYAAAFRAADLGLDVTMVNMEAKPGGVCLFTGCIPSKTLLYAAEVIHSAREVESMGIQFGEPKIDLGKLRDFKNSVIDKLSKGLSYLGEKRGVQFIKAQAEFESSSEVRLHDSDLSRMTFGHAILATGSLPNCLPNLSFQKGSRIMDSAAALALRDIPESLLIIGGGYVGLEIGTIYASLGSRITVVEMGDRLMAGTDRDLMRPLEKQLKGLFEGIHLRTTVKDLKEHDHGVDARLEGEAPEPERTFDRVLIAIGRRPNTKDAGLDRTKVKLNDRGFVIVNEQRRTADEKIFAVGDVTGGEMLAHKAFAEGRVAAEAIAGMPSVFDVRTVPKVVFTDPQVAWCGVTEEEARAGGQPIRVEHFPWSASGRATSMGVSEGMTKMILDPDTERVLGVGIVGRGAGELISEAVLAVEMAAVAEDVALSIHPHPTLSESVHEAAGVFLGTSTDILPRKEKPRQPS